MFLTKFLITGKKLLKSVVEVIENITEKRDQINLCASTIAIPHLPGTSTSLEKPSYYLKWKTRPSMSQIGDPSNSKN